MVSGINSPPWYETSVEIEEWMQDLEDFVVGKFGTIDDPRKLAILRRVFGDTHIGTLKEIISRLPAEERVRYQPVKTALIGHFARIRSSIVERHQFHIMKQQLDEPIDSFVSRLHEQVAKCNFLDMRYNIIQ